VTPSNTPFPTGSASAAASQTQTPTRSLPPGASPSGTPAPAVVVVVALTLSGAGAARNALLQDSALAALRGGLACLAGPGVPAAAVLALATADGAGTNSLPIPAGLPGNTAPGAACAAGAAARAPEPLESESAGGRAGHARGVARRRRT
jgi:hypothetical protein